MEKKRKDINNYIPYGELIRAFANQTPISTSEIKRLLKERGVFFPPSSEKDVIVPFLQTLLLSPQEFDYLRDCYQIKEDNQKVISRVIEWNNNVEKINNIEIDFQPVYTFVNDKLSNCKLKRAPTKTVINDNPNHIQIEFEIEREDLNKSWFEQKNDFKANLEIVKDDDSDNGTFRITYTSPETKKIVDFFTKDVIQQYKKKNIIKGETNTNPILFNSFSNKERITFFLRLSGNIESLIFTNGDIIDISIKPDDSDVLPEKIKWMESLKKLLISGQKLNKSLFLKDKNWHKHIILWELHVRFKYTINELTGECSFVFGFPDYITKQKEDAEFEMKITGNPTIPKHSKLNSRDKNILRQKLLREMDKKKNDVYFNFIQYLKEKSSV